MFLDGNETSCRSYIVKQTSQKGSLARNTQVLAEQSRDVRRSDAVVTERHHFGFEAFALK